MKRSVFHRVLSLLLFLMSVVNISVVADRLRAGDIDRNGRIDASDALLVLQSSVKLFELMQEEVALVDVDISGKVDATDALLILQYSVGLIDRFENESIFESRPAPTLTLIENGSSRYGIVAVSNEVAPLAEALRTELSAAYGIELPLSTGINGASILLVIGDTALGTHSYAFSVQGEALTIHASDAEAMSYALGTFVTTYVKPQKETGILSLPTTELPSRCGDTPFALAEAITAELTIQAKHKKVFDYGKKTIGKTTFGTAQGICTDGEALYFTIRNSDDSSGIVVKTDMKGNELNVSAPVDLGHANDMTYDSLHHRLVIAHGSSQKNTVDGNDNGRRLSFLDADTLRLLYTKKNVLPKGYAAGAITYLAATDTYFISRGGSAFRLANITTDYQITGLLNPGRASREAEGSTSYVAQGMGTDGRYIYFPMSGETDNILVVYTLDAQYVQTISIPTEMESESLCFVGDNMYICYNSGGAVIGKLLFTATYE